MSTIKVSDKSGGIYQAVIEFTYGECERLPFNILRRIGAKMKTVPGGGVIATAGFNIRSPGDSAAFLEMLDLFGENGTFTHGSAADPSTLSQVAPPAEVSPLRVTVDDDDLEVEGSLNELG